MVGSWLSIKPRWSWINISTNCEGVAGAQEGKAFWITPLLSKAGFGFEVGVGGSCSAMSSGLCFLGRPLLRFGATPAADTEVVGSGPRLAAAGRTLWTTGVGAAEVVTVTDVFSRSE